MAFNTSNLHLVLMHIPHSSLLHTVFALLVAVMVSGIGTVYSASPVMAAEQATPAKRTGTGLPLPRFVSLRDDQANLRTGPGIQYPVEWVYTRKNLPVEIIAEYHTWRKIRDWQGTQGWVHQSMLSGKRSLVVTGSVRTVRRSPEPKALPIARAEPGVVGHILSCPVESTWCNVEVDGFKGWLRRVDFWGVYSLEVFK